MKRRFIITLILLCSFMTGASAQTTTGRLVGTVSGPDGRIAGATVKAVDNQTGKERVAVASDEGTYTISQLDAGTYTVTIEAQGFKTVTASDLKIDVGRDYSLSPTLEVGGVTESVTIMAGADVINAADGSLSSSISPRQVKELPLNGRDPTALIRLQAGTASNGAQNTSVNGQRPTFTNITRDGINIQDNHIRGNASDFAVQRPSVDDVGEITVTTQNAGAELGYGASQLQLVTPRGQNEFHGALFEYNRNSKFSSNTFFNNAAGVQRPFLNRNQFGFNLSGPVIKNKVFFFGFYEGTRRRQQTSALRTILTPNARQGIFTYVDNAGVTRTVSLFSLLPVSAGITGVDPVVQSRLLSLLPAAGNTTDRGDQRNTTGYRFNRRNNGDTDKYTSRVDYDITDRQALSLVFSYADERVLDRPDANNTEGFTLEPNVIQPSNRIFSSTAYRWSPTPNLTNELRAGFFFSDPFFSRAEAQPAFFITPTLISNPESTFQDQGRDTRNYTIQDNADYLWGNHSLRFGGQWQVISDHTVASFDTIPRYTLGTNTNTPTLTASLFPGGISAGQLGTANGLLSLVGGIVSAGTQNFNAQSRTSGFVPAQGAEYRYRFDTYSLHFADQWRVSPRLVLNLGLRYDLFTPLRETTGLAIEPVIPEGMTVEQAVFDPNGRFDFINGYGNNKLHKTDKNNFGPVVSFAYSPQIKNKFLGAIFGSGDSTVIRGGFRMSYVNDEILRSQDSSQQTNPGLATNVTRINLNGRLGAPPAIPTPQFRLPITFAEYNAAQANFGAIFAIDPNYQVARSNEYNIGIQREIGASTVLEVRYVGGYSNNLPRGLDINNLDQTNNGFLNDFLRARENCRLQGGGDIRRCTDARYNPAIPGSQPLTVFPNFGGGGLLNNATIVNTIISGQPQALLLTYIQNNLQGTVRLRQNENAGTISILTNGARYNYNSLQMEVRRRFSQGLYFQANYTFQKTLTNATGSDQFKFNFNLDNSRPELEYSRADYDQTHVFNFNGIYELPFGKDKRWLNRGGLLNQLVGGFQVTSIVNISSGAPYSFSDVRGTINRVSRSGRQTPLTSLSKDQIKDLVGIFRTPCGVFFINPSVININLNTCQGTGRASEGLNEPAFPGQVFFNNGPGQTGSLENAFINGPLYVNWDASIIKNFRLGETKRFQIRAEVFNVLNRANFFAGGLQSGTGGVFDINSQSFGRISSTFTSTGAQRVVQFAGRFEF